MDIIWVFLFFSFVVGILYYIKPAFKESLTTDTIPKSIKVELPYTQDCPNMLLERDSSYYLFNKDKPYEAGVNPIIFNNLEEYSGFVQRERMRGNNCPILFLQQSYNPQGEREYKIRPSPNDLQGGAPTIMPSTNKTADRNTYLDMLKDMELLIDANQSNMPYNVNSYPAFDPMNQDVGEKTPLDLMDEIQWTKDKSPNPEDPNWGGDDYTQSLIDNGFYNDNTVLRYGH
uniref:Uncharacterized protein n=1 Tax=viral metagenome TaxID=1070528 RepID=A0A6C0HRM0_9ZZZZ